MSCVWVVASFVALYGMVIYLHTAVITEILWGENVIYNERTST